jgi:hypothetical protein|nr:hypothetical protein [Neorhizobium tomejilense]
MKSLLPLIVVLCAVGFLSVNALNFGDQVASEGMAALNEKYVGRCLGLTDGRKATIIAVRGKNLRVADVGDGSEGNVFTVQRVPDLDRYFVNCPSVP